MKILMFGWEFPPHISGGLGIACHDITKALLDLDVNISFVMPKLIKEIDSPSKMELLDATDYVQTTETAGWKEMIAFFPLHSILSPYLTETQYQQVIDYQTNNFFSFDSQDYGHDLISEVHRYAASAEEIVRNNPHDIIHIHDWMTIPSGIIAKRISQKPLILHIHSLEKDRCGDGVNEKIFEIEKKGMEAADLVVAVSNYTKNCIIKNYHISPDKIEVVHNAVSKEKKLKIRKIKNKRKDKIVLFLGRVTFQKGPDYFLEAAAKVINARKNVCFVMAGTGDMIHRLINRVAQLKISHKFHFTGFLNRQEVERMYSISDVYVMPSVSEPFGIAPLEALSYDVPVIISKQSGVSEVLRHALKVDFWNTNDLADNIIALLDRPVLRKYMLSQAAEELKHIQWEKAGQHISDIYHRLKKD